MRRPVCSQLLPTILLALQVLFILFFTSSTNLHISSVLAQEYSVQQIHIDQIYVEEETHGVYTRVDRYTSKLSATVAADASQSQALLNQHNNHQDHAYKDHPPQHQHQQVSADHHVHSNEYVMMDEHQLELGSNRQHELHRQVHDLSPAIETSQREYLHQPRQQLDSYHHHEQHQKHNHQQQHPQHSQQYYHAHNYPLHQQDQLDHNYAEQQIHGRLHHQHQSHHEQQQVNNNHHQQNLHQHSVQHEEHLYVEHRQQNLLLSQHAHQHTQIQWRRESTPAGVFSEYFMHNLEASYPIARDSASSYTGSCKPDDDSSMWMIHPPFNSGGPTCLASLQSPEYGSGQSSDVAGFAQQQHPNKPSQNSNVVTYPLASHLNHHESSRMTAIFHYWREISLLCLASAIALNWLFVFVKRRLVASGFTRSLDSTADMIDETVQRTSTSTTDSSLPTKQATKDSCTLNSSSAQDSAFEETASPMSHDDGSTSRSSSSLRSRPRSSTSSTPCCANTLQPNLSLNNSTSNTSEYMSRYSSDFDSIRRLGRGGFGIVFEAKNKIDDCHYAVKRICLPLEKEARERVMREVRALAKLDHAGIVRYYNAWLETPPDEWLKQHDAQLGIVHTVDGLSFPSSDGIQDKNEAGRCPIREDDNCAEKLGESGDTSNDFFSKKSLFGTHRTNNYLKENSTSQSLDIVFEGSGSIRLEAENSSEPEIQSVTRALHVEKVYLYIQMQLCRKDTLKDWLRTNCGTRDKTTIFDFFYQIVDAVEYVHSQDLIHRDLKPSNIFFSLDGTLKIGDFGLCRAKTSACVGSSLDLKEYVADSSDAVHTEQVGTQLYMSPEQMNGLSYNHKVDVFAMGLILVELLIPFKTQMQRVNVLLKARNNMFSREFKSDYPDEHELVRSLLDRRPYKRPTAAAIKEHELLSNAQLSQPVIERIYHRRRTISNNSSTE